MFICEVCGLSLSSKYNFKRHIIHNHSNINIKKNRIISVKANEEEVPSCSYRRCETCVLNVIKSSWSHHLRTNEHKKKVNRLFINNDTYIIKNLFNKRIQTFVYENKKEGELSPSFLFSNAKESIKNILENMLLEHINIKYNLELFAEYIKFSKNNEIENDNTAELSIKSFQSKMMTVQSEFELSDMYDNHTTNIITKMDEFQEREIAVGL